MYDSVMHALFFYTTCQKYMAELAENRNSDQLFCQFCHIKCDNIKGWNNSFFLYNQNCKCSSK